MIEFNTPTEIISLVVLKIEKVRKRKKITQKELSLKSGIPYGSYREMIDNKSISLKNFISILQVLNMLTELKCLVENTEVKTIAQMKEEDKKWK